MGKYGYNAPEVYRREMEVYASNVDVWSLGCILLELCLDRKPSLTGHDLPRREAEFELPEYLAEAANVFNKWICDMLNPLHERRPSAYDLGARFSELRCLVTVTTAQLEECWASHKHQFLDSIYLLGTEMPPQHVKTPRLETVLTTGTDPYEVSSIIDHRKRILTSRNLLLGPENPYTTWSKTSSRGPNTTPAFHMTLTNLLPSY